MNDQIRLIDGGVAIDDRGSLAFMSDLPFADIKRFYLVTNHRSEFVRAWHAHRREAKYVTSVSGAAVVGVVRIDDWERPSRDLRVERHVLSAARPQILYVPPGHANGFMSLTADTTLLFFSTATLDESREDDVRYEARYWDVWNVTER